MEGTVVDARTGSPLQNAKVTLVAGLEDWEERHTSTNASGRFAFADLAPGRYLLRASHELYVTRAYMEPHGNTFPLAPGEQRKDIVLALTPTAVVTGRVLTPDGDPARGVSVVALSYSYSRGRRWQAGGSATVRTNDRGEYRVWGVHPGPTYVIAHGARVPGTPRPLPETDDGFVTARTFYPSALDVPEATPLSIRGGEEREDIDIRLLRVPTYEVSGVIEGVESAGKDSGYSVMLQENVRLGGNGRGQGLRPGESEFSIKGVHPGSYILTARGGDPRQRLYASQRVDVASENITGLTLRLRPPMELTGVVEAEEGAGPIAYSRLRVLVDPLEAAESSATAVPVYADGGFHLRNLQTAPYEIDVLDLPGGLYLRSARLGEQDLLADPVLREAADSEKLKLVIAAATAFVTGTVRGMPEDPEADVLVWLVPQGLPYSSRLNLTRPETDGRFRLRGVAPGSYRLVAANGLPEGGWDDPAYTMQLKGRVVPLEIEDNEARSVELTLVDISEGKP